MRNGVWVGTLGLAARFRSGMASGPRCAVDRAAIGAEVPFVAAAVSDQRGDLPARGDRHRAPPGYARAPVVPGRRRPGGRAGGVLDNAAGCTVPTPTVPQPRSTSKASCTALFRAIPSAVDRSSPGCPTSISMRRTTSWVGSSRSTANHTSPSSPRSPAAEDSASVVAPAGLVEPATGRRYDRRGFLTSSLGSHPSTSATRHSHAIVGLRLPPRIAHR